MIPSDAEQSPTDRIERTIELKASVARVWRALTDHREFGEWFRVDLQAAFEPGKQARGQLTYPGYEHLEMELVVRKMVAEQLFSFEWHPYAIDPTIDYSNEPPTLVVFTLEATAEGTRLTVTESGFDALPAARRDEAFRMNSDGWRVQITNLETYLHENA